MKNFFTFVSLFLLTTTPLGAREFPLCLYSVNNPDDLKTVKRAGFSCIQSYKQEPETLDALAQAAKKQGLKVVFYPNQILGTPYEQNAQDWPLLAWYLVDEPDVHKWSRARVTQTHQAAKAAFPNHATALVVGQGKTATPFYDIPDVMMMDWYPVPHLPLTSFGDNVRYTKEGMTQRNVQDHPLWGVVQIFDWKNFKQYRPDHDRVGRFPTEQEIRFMSYDGILNGATGLFYYTFNHLGKPLPQSAPEYWKRVTAVTKELAKFKKVIEDGIITENPIVISLPLKMKTWYYKKHLYSVLLNTSDEPHPLPAQLMDKSFKALYGRKKEENLSPYEVWVFKH